MNNPHEVSWELPLAAWAEWSPENGAELPKLDFVDPMLRRRLSALSKASLWVAHQCASELTDVRMIYASQHGEIKRTTEMLAELAAGEALSPTAFSMSVLNASIGLYSILRGNTAPATAIAAGEETLAYALLEAHGQLRMDPARPVLVIYADETVPDVWDTQATPPHALALLLANNAKTRLQCSRQGKAAHPVANATQALTLAKCLTDDIPVEWLGENSRWQWQRLAA